MKNIESNPQNWKIFSMGKTQKYYHYSNKTHEVNKEAIESMSQLTTKFNITNTLAG
jgi:ribosomal protein S17E